MSQFEVVEKILLMLDQSTKNVILIYEGACIYISVV